MMFLGIIAGVLAAAFGLVMVLAGGMSDSPYETTSKAGCAVALGGIALVVGSVWIAHG